MSSLPAWPPSLSPEEMDHLTTLALDYALGHGLVYRPPLTEGATLPAPAATISAPFALFPSPWPRVEYEKALNLQEIYNTLYARITLNPDFLSEVMQSVIPVDSFQASLWNLYKSLSPEVISSQIHLGLCRSDYLLHVEEGAKPDSLPVIKQVEFNTISSSFGGLSQRVAELHRYLQSSTSYFNSTPLLTAPLPVNEPVRGLALGLAKGHQAWVKLHPEVKDAQVLMVVQVGERNAFDQRELEWELLKTHGIHLIRQTFPQLATSLQLSSSSSFLTLHNTPISPKTPIPISLVYYRAGYTPTDYPTQQAWDTRLLVEQSNAVKCPTVALQLSGAKKVQQVLSDKGLLEKFLQPSPSSTSSLKSYTDAEIEALRESFVGLYSMEVEGTLDLALSKPEQFVLKPQREGGGNNIYRDSIPPFIKSLPRASDINAYILMQLIQPPAERRNVLVRGGGDGKGVEGDVVSELGVYGCILFGAQEDDKDGIWWNGGAAGTLLRTKGRESDEGGVAVGYSVLDSLCLVD